MVYINTLIIQQILSQPHWQNRFTPEDYRALTPLFSGHINPYSEYNPNNQLNIEKHSGITAAVRSENEVPKTQDVKQKLVAILSPE